MKNHTSTITAQDLLTIAYQTARNSSGKVRETLYLAIEGYEYDESSAPILIRAMINAEQLLAMQEMQSGVTSEQEAA